jgi:hypothetical protein
MIDERKYSFWWNENWQGKTKYAEKLDPILLCPPQIPYKISEKCFPTFQREVLFQSSW